MSRKASGKSHRTFITVVELTCQFPDDMTAEVRHRESIADNSPAFRAQA